MESDLERRTLAKTLALGSRALYRDGTYYDQLYRRRSHDVRFYVEVARAHARGGPVLELGVGTARVAAALARAGHQVVGIDTMQPMLDAARRRLARLPSSMRGRVELRRADVRRLRLTQRFPLIIAPFNVFQHLYTRRDMERALATVRSHLRARGRLVFDVLLPDPRALAQSPGRLLKGRPVFHPGEGRRYEYYEASHYDARSQVRTIHMVLQPPGRRDQTPGPQRVIPLAHRQFFPAELEALLHYNGFVLERLYGDFDRSVLTEASESQVVIARLRPR